MKHSPSIMLLFLFSISVLYLFPSGANAQEGKEPSLEIGGVLDIPYTIMLPNQDSPIFNLQYAGKPEPDILSTYPFTLYLNGDYQTAEMGVHIRTATTVSGESDPSFLLYELYGNYSPSDHSLIQFGKRNLRWGKGYAFTSVGYLSPEKDPEDPEASLAGYPLINTQFTWSFASDALNNISVDFILLPAVPTSTVKQADAEYTGVAGKLYLMLWDTDIDIMGYYSKDKPTQYGMDFSRNIVSELEVHGELSRFQDEKKYLLSGGTLKMETIDGFAYLLGLRWLSSWNATTIFEYYHTDAGLTRNEFLQYRAYLSNVSKVYFSRPALMKDYLYLKVSQPEPFGIVDTSVSLYSIYNLNDRGVTAGLQIGYKPVTNLELSFQNILFIGPESSEFGNKLSLYKAILEVKLSF